MRMTAKELEDRLKNCESLGRAVALEWKCPHCPRVHRGVAIHLGGNLSRSWQSGDILVFWNDGDHTMLVGGEIEPDSEVEVLTGNLIGDPI